jgi:hypothetical protein
MSSSSTTSDIPIDTHDDLLGLLLPLDESGSESNQSESRSDELASDELASDESGSDESGSDESEESEESGSDDSELTRSVPISSRRAFREFAQFFFHDDNSQRQGNGAPRDHTNAAPCPVSIRVNISLPPVITAMPSTTSVSQTECIYREIGSTLFSWGGWFIAIVLVAKMHSAL